MTTGQMALEDAVSLVGGDRHEHAARGGTHPTRIHDEVIHIDTVSDARNLDPVAEPTVSIAAIGGPDA